MNFKDFKKECYCNSTSFPKVEKNPRNDKVAKKIIEIYAGSKSELTAICQYSYESFYTKMDKNFEELSEIIEKISICEMRHLEVLSQILLSMDINPKFCKYIDNNYSICNYWSAGNIKYITDVNKFIDYNIKLEENTIHDYKELLELTDSQNIIDIVNVIIEDELLHLEIFKGIKEMLDKKYEKNSRSSDTDNDNEITINNNDDEIVNIFWTSHAKESSNTIKNTFEDIENKLENKTDEKNEDIINEVIQIPITDITNLGVDEKDLRCRLEEKVYSPDEIVDG